MQTGSLNPTVLKTVGLFSSGKPIQSIEMTGTVNTHYGTDDHGPAILSLNANGDSTVEYSLSKGINKETAGITNPAKACSWTGPDGVLHQSPFHNCVRGIVWFLPAFSLQRAANSTKDNFASDSAQNTLGSLESVRHNRTFSSSKEKTNIKLQQLSETLIEIDSLSGMIATIRYNIHPDKTATVNIPVEVRYSDYRESHGLRVPFKIQKIVNGTLIEELTIENITIN